MTKTKELIARFRAGIVIGSDGDKAKMIRMLTEAIKGLKCTGDFSHFDPRPCFPHANQYVAPWCENCKARAEVERIAAE